MRCVAIIPARGGSKRIPKKNIKTFIDKPIIAYSIEAAIRSGIFCEVMVSTDSQEISEIAVKYGAKIPFLRSDKCSNDYATTNDVLYEVLDNYKDMGEEFDAICCIYPTAPFVTSQKLKDAYKLLEDGANSVMPVVKYSFPPQRAMIIKDNILDYQYPKFSQLRSQDMVPIYHDCGQFYFYRLVDGKFLDGEYTPIIVPELEVQDIDTYEDWKLAEIKYELMMEE